MVSTSNNQLIGTEGDDDLWAAYGEQVSVYGLGGNDTIHSGVYVDGGAGNDTIYSSGEYATIIGGEGDDTVVSSYGTHQINTGTGDDTYIFDSNHAATRDTVDLGSGNDTAYIAQMAGQSNSTVNGGDGIDLLAVSASNVTGGQTTFDFRNPAALNIQGWEVSGFERFEFAATSTTKLVYFGDYDDSFEGLFYATRVTVDAGGGNDFLDSAGGIATFHGGSGDDTIISQGGSQSDVNYIFGDEGNDTIYSNYRDADYNSNSELTGGSGSDGFITLGSRLSADFDYIMDFDPSQDWLGLSYAGTVSIPGESQRTDLQKTNVVDNANQLSFDTVFQNQDAGQVSTPFRVIYDRQTGALSFTDLSHRFTSPITQFILKNAPSLVLSDFYGMTIQVQTDANDLLTGTDFDDHLEGDGGADTIYGGSGNDVIHGDGRPYYLTTPADGADNLYGQDGNDVLYGEDGNDYLDGGDGDDWLDGGTGNNTLYGGNGNDNLTGGSGADYLDGGQGGIDFIRYDSAGAGVIVNLLMPSANTGDAAGDTYVSIEGIYGSTGYGDLLSGDDSANIIYGQGGDDNLLGQAGDDALYGGDGNDNLYGGAGGDYLAGDNGFDAARYETATAGVTAVLVNSSLNTGDAAGDRYFSIEALVGSKYNDNLIGDNGNNLIWGGAGNDAITGYAGNDTLYGGGDGNVFFFQANSGSDLIMDFTATSAVHDTLFLGSNLNGSGITDFNSAMAHAADGSSGVVFDLGAGNSLTLQGVQKAQLAASDFAFG